MVVIQLDGTRTKVKPKCAGIYGIRHLASGQLYVGSAQSINLRWNIHIHHLRQGTHIARYLQHAFSKHGEDAFAFEVLEIVEGIDDLLAHEQVWLDRTQATDPKFGYNTRTVAASNRGHKHSAETLAKMRAVQKVVQSTPEARARVGLRSKGRVMSAEARLKLSVANRGRIITPEWRAAISAGLKGRKLSPEHIEKQRANMTGKIPAGFLDPRHVAETALKNTGRKNTPETRAQMSASALLRWQTNPNSAEHRAAIIAVGRSRAGTKASLETKAKMSEAQRKRGARERAERARLNTIAVLERFGLWD